MRLEAGGKLGPYQILSPLGEGGMGEVYRARDTRLDRDVALKVLPSHLSADPEYRERLHREARIIASLNHPGICTLHDIGEECGCVYLVLEYLEGATLQVLLDRGSLPPAQVLNFGIEIAGALETAHGKGITHRDIKPANIFVTKTGQVKVLDFGLAKHGMRAAAADSVETVAFASKPATTVGTVGYMSPEQVLGRELDARSDLFSLGIVLYRAATGTGPFHGTTAGEISDAILHQPAPSATRVNPAVPALLDNVIQKALEKDAELRYQSASEMRADLRRAKRDSQSSIEVPVLPPPRPVRSYPVTLMIAIAAVVVLLGSFVLLRSRRAAVRAESVTEKQLTANPAELPVYTAAISADGKSLAYSDSTGFYIRLLQTSETNPLKLPPGFCFR